MSLTTAHSFLCSCRVMSVAVFLAMCPCLGGLVLVAVEDLVGGVTPNSLVMLLLLDGRVSAMAFGVLLFVAGPTR
jgi:hypothetical protein